MEEPAEIPFETFVENAGSGDLVLFTGTSLVSLAVEAATFTAFSHVAMVIVDPASGDKYLFQSVIEDLGADPLSPGRTHPGVQATPLAHAVQWLHDGGDYPTWRQLVTWPKRNDGAIWGAAGQIDGHAFPVVWEKDGKTLNDLATLAFVMTLWYEGKYAKKETLDPLFCSGAVAYVLQKAGILDASTYPPNAFEPADFSSIYPSIATWTAGVEWADDVFIAMPPS